jgi:hypothetical protein
MRPTTRAVLQTNAKLDDIGRQRHRLSNNVMTLSCQQVMVSGGMPISSGGEQREGRANMYDSDRQMYQAANNVISFARQKMMKSGGNV